MLGESTRYSDIAPVLRAEAGRPRNVRLQKVLTFEIQEPINVLTSGWSTTREKTNSGGKGTIILGVLQIFDFDFL